MKKLNITLKKKKLSIKFKTFEQEDNKNMAKTYADKIKNLNERIKNIEENKQKVIKFLAKYYQNGKIKDEYYNRLDKKLIECFEKGLLHNYYSNNVLLRKNEQIKALDYMRKIKWD